MSDSKYFYDDVLGDHDGRFSHGFLGETPVSIKIKTNPGSGVRLWHAFTVHKKFEDEQIAGSEDVRQVAKYHQDNAVKLKVARDIYNFSALLTNHAAKVVIEAEPK